MINVTDIRVRLLEAENNVRAIVSMTIDKCFVIHDIKVLDGKNGLFVTMPGRRNADGTFRDLAHPLNTHTREAIQAAVLAQYEKEKARN